ncbi:cupin-like domain-containing protein [Portibacter lacus]|uniref:JmjC domain-containing protein n=1 Tax=Portibacter lacus TaxID=1099794 RepID=A0AA37WCV1_9BACT|nr:cupin-like domain-containing protein [Portibacter lacus]GLR16916.1 hypothetical protein GCM10007940_15310 [Portibacter lacus]
MKLNPIEKVQQLSKADFTKYFLEPKRPVIFKDLSAQWPAVNKWTFDYFKENYGDLEVSLIDKSFNSAENYFKSVKKLRFYEYLDLLEQNKPIDLRLFLFDIFKEAPELTNDISFPEIMNGFIKNYKFMFFGGRESVTNLHFDVDCSHVFLTQFQTRKKVILFSPEESKKLYHLPFTTMSKFDPENPDFEKYPLAEYLNGYEGTIEHGETVFIPSEWWHYLRYIDGGFSLALRANDSPLTILKGGLHLVQHQLIDLSLSKVLGANWHKWKEDQARKKAKKLEHELV